MTISEYMQRQQRKARLANLAFTLCAAVEAAFAIYSARSGGEGYGGMRFRGLMYFAPVAFIGILLVGYFTRGFECPKCGGDLEKALKAVGNPNPIKRCPLCNADFSEEMH